MLICICMYICMYVCMYVHVCIYECLYVCIYMLCNSSISDYARCCIIAASTRTEIEFDLMFANNL